MKDRKRNRASGVYRLEPMFENSKGVAVTVEGKTFHIDGRLGDCLVLSVPESTTRAAALELEQSIGDVAKKPVLIVTHNMKFLRATLLTAKEKAELAEALKEATTPAVPEEQAPEPLSVGDIPDLPNTVD